MQTIEKALHQPMPFTTGGQTISDRLTAAKHSLAGSQLGKTICKATTEELMAPKKKHLDYLLHCTNEPNVSIPSMANLLIERTQHPNWTVVYKALITIHNIMCYGNERFSQYLASCNTTFNLGNFLDKNSTSGYDMSQHVRRYGKYIGEKIATYRVCAFDFCKVKRGREDGLLRTMHTDKLLKTLPILQNQIDALLEFQVSASELNNGVINCSFILLFRDLIRLFACYNDGIINLLEKYFDMNKKQCREALDTYKGFLTRLDKVSDFLRVAESVGIDRGEIPDLTRAPASLLEALEAHLIHLEGGRAPPPQNQFHMAQSQVTNFSMTGGFQVQPHVGDAERQRYIELEKERLRQFEEHKRQQGGNITTMAPSQFNPFAAEAASSSSSGAKKPSDDLLDLFNMPSQNQPIATQMDTTNPFAQFTTPLSGATTIPTGVYPNMTDTNPFHANAIGTTPQQWQPDFGSVAVSWETQPETIAASSQEERTMGAAISKESTNAEVNNPFGITQQSVQTVRLSGSNIPSSEPQIPSNHSSSNNSPVPFQQQHLAAGAHILTQQPMTINSTSPIPLVQQNLGIYDQTPFSHMDGSYSAQPAIPPHLIQSGETSSKLQSPAHQGFSQQQQQGNFDPFNTSQQQQSRMGGDIDSALSNLADNLTITGNNQGKPVHWGGQPQPGANSIRPSGQSAVNTQIQSAQMQAYGTPHYVAPFGQYVQPNYGQTSQLQWGIQPPGLYGISQQQPTSYGFYAGAPMGYSQIPGQIPQQPTQNQPKDPFGF